MRKLKLLFAALALLIGGVGTANAYTTDELESAGWTKITTISQSDITDKYYVFVANDADLMLGLATSATQSSTAAFYQTLANPALDAKKVWLLEANGENYGMRNLYSNSRQMQTEYSGSSNDLRWRTNDQTASISWTGLGLTYAEGAWTLTSTQYSRPLGIYNNVTDSPTEGQEIGANDAGNGQKFQIYAISRDDYWNLAASLATKAAPVNSFTGAISNQEIYNKDKSKLPNGWSEADRTTGNSNRTAGTGLTVLEAWSSSTLKINYSQNLTVPSGVYRLTAKAGDSNQTGGGNIYISNGTTEKSKSFTSNAADGIDETTETIVTDGSLTIGMRADGNNSWVHATDFRLEYLGKIIRHVALALPVNGAIAANTWYKYTVAVDGEYIISAATAGDISQTTDGEQFAEDGIGTALVTGNNVALNAGDVIYYKSSSANTLTIEANIKTYTVGAVTATSIADNSYQQSLTTVTFTLGDATTNDNTASLALQGTPVAKLKVGSSDVADGALSISGNVVTATYTSVTLDPAKTYTITLPAEAIAWDKDNTNKNSEKVITFNTPDVFDGTYYLYDETNKRFLSRGANYGTRATVDLYGIPVIVTTNAANATLISFLDWSDTFMFFDNSDHAGCWLYTDGAASKGDDRLFTFEKTTGGYYLRDAAKAVYVRHDNSVLTVPTTNEGEATKWTLKSNTEYNAIVAQYATDNKNNVITSASLTTTADEFDTYLTDNYAAKDKTSKIVMPKFTSDTEADGAAWPFTQVRSDGNINYGVDYAEAFRKSGSFAQTITGLDKGIYKVTVNAFERINGYEVCNSMGGNGWEPVTASFEANGETVRLASWYSDKTGESNPNNTGEAATAFNNDKYKIVLYTYVDNSGELELKINKPSFAWSSWVLFNNVTLTYYEALTDQDKLDIIAEAATEMAKPMKPSLYQALSSAKATFEGAQTVPNYNALRTAIENTATSVASYASMNTKYIEPVAALLASSNIIDQTSSAYTDYVAYKAKYDNYTDALTADIENADANALNLWQGNGARYTNVANILMTTGWQIGGADALTDGSGFYANTWSTENEGTAPAKDFARPFYEMWVSSGSIAAATLTRTITGLTANAYYSVSANVRVQYDSKVDGSITMKAGSGEAVDVTAGSKIGDTQRYIDAYTSIGQADGDGKLTITFTVAENSGISWLTFRDVNYNEVDAANIAQASDYTALNTAISAAESKTLGFENGEYAPYNNAAALQALATAKAIDQNAINMKATVTSATTALTGATWTANTEEMNAVYDGNFTIQTEHTTGPTALNGWNNPEGIRQLIKNTTTYPGLNSASENSAVFAWGNTTMTYGNTEGYTMPLAANTAYELSFKTCGWSDGDMGYVKVTVLNDASEGMAEQTSATATKRITEDNPWNEFRKVFVTGDAGNYKLGMWTSKHTVFTDIVLKKAAPESVTVTAAGYATYVSDRPLDFTSTEIKAYTAKVNAGKVVLTQINKVPANTPVVLYKEGGATESIPVATTTDTPAASDLVAGTGAAVATDGGTGYTNYILNNGTNGIGFYLAAGQTVAKNRAYLHVDNANKTAAPALTIVFDGDATGVNDVRSKMADVRGEVYDLQGRKVAKPAKGMYIVNGKKVIVK